MVVDRQPTELEINTVYDAYVDILPYINRRDGTLTRQGWHAVNGILMSLTDFELWLGLCNLEAVIFGGEDYNAVSPAHMTLFELFHIAYEQATAAY